MPHLAANSGYVISHSPLHLRAIDRLAFLAQPYLRLVFTSDQNLHAEIPRDRDDRLSEGGVVVFPHCRVAGLGDGINAWIQEYLPKGRIR